MSEGRAENPEPVQDEPVNESQDDEIVSMDILQKESRAITQNLMRSLGEEEDAIEIGKDPGIEASNEQKKEKETENEDNNNKEEEQQDQPQEGNNTEENNENELGELPFQSAGDENESEEDEPQVTTVRDLANMYNGPLFMKPPEPEEVEASFASLMDHQTVPIENLRIPVLQLINRKKLEALQNAEYDFAEKLDHASELLQANEEEQQYERNERIRQCTIDEHSDMLYERLKMTKDSYDYKIEQIKQNKERAIIDAEEKHKQETKEFRKKWQDSAFLAQFNKPSYELIELRQVERRLACSKCYEEAKLKKKYADKLQKHEEEEMQRTIETEMKKAFFAMKERQAQEIEKIEAHQDKIIQQLYIKKEREIKPMEHSLKQMYIKKNTKPNKKLHTLPKGISSINEFDIPASQTLKQSPRTQLGFSVWRHEKKGELRIQPVENSIFSRLVAEHPIVRPISKYQYSRSRSNNRKKLNNL